MADNVAITAGAGTTIATDERTIASATVQIQRIDPIGSSAFDPEQIAPTSAATAASIAARDTRSRVVLVNYGTADLYVSDRATNAGTPATTTAHSVKFPVGASMELRTTAALYIFTASGTGACHYWEEYDS